MDSRDFLRIVTAFADSPANIDLEKGTFLVEIRGELIEGELLTREGQLFVSESGESAPANRWIINRIARLQLLADRLLEHVPEERFFVVPEGTLLDTLEDVPEDNINEIEDSAGALVRRLDRRLAGTTFLCYLTSDAGEGKTTLINQVAREQARAYKEKRTDWLLLPVPLGGRTLLRFDDVIIGTLVNRFRFQLWYYEALIELVRMGIVIPALDGFEEMFIESSTGEAVSALGNLVRNLQSSGTVLIAARKAYFEYKSFETQAKLYDTIEKGSVATARLGIRRWGKGQFLQYASKRGIQSGDQIYDDVAQRLGPQHPILTRAVLIARLVEVASSVTDRKALLDKLGAAPQEFYAQFVQTILDREIREKWIDRSGEPHRPLLSEEEHYHLLSLLAQEMWANSTDALGEDVLDLISDLFSEQSRKAAAISRQIKERLKQHALINRLNHGKGTYRFDHEEFQSFFLGWGIAYMTMHGSPSDVRRLLEPEVLPPQAADTAAHFLRSKARVQPDIISQYEALCAREGTASLLRENCGAIVIRLVDGWQKSNQKLASFSFPVDALSGRKFFNIYFDGCYFQPTSLEGSSLQDCGFVKCVVERLDLGGTFSVNGTVLSDTQVLSLGLPNGETHLYDPADIGRRLVTYGFSIVKETREDTTPVPRPPDQELQAAQRVFRAFLRATEINENVIRLKAGKRWEYVLDELTRGGVLELVPYRGGGVQKRFRLAAKMRPIERALRECDGTLEDFIAKMKGS